jgi:hypothetical protein
MEAFYLFEELPFKDQALKARQKESCRKTLKLLFANLFSLC